MLGGDPNPLTQRVLDASAARDRGLKNGGGHPQLVSYHGSGPRPDAPLPSSSVWVHEKDWLDFNVVQSGHRWGVKNFEFIAHDYELKPVKPTIDVEPRYEDHHGFRRQWTADGRPPGAGGGILGDARRRRGACLRIKQHVAVLQSGSHARSRRQVVPLCAAPWH